MPLLIFGVVVAIWGLLGWADVRNWAQGGYGTDGNHTITQVLAGSPAEAAGLEVGDYVLSYNGVASENSAGLAEMGRPRAGDTWTFNVRRGEETVDVNVTFGELVPQRKLTAHGGFVVGFCFLGFALWAYLKRQTMATMVLATTGALMSLAFLGGPYFASHSVRGVVNGIVVILIFLGLASLFRFSLVYPKASGFLDKANARFVVFGPGLVAGLFLAYRNIFSPPSTGGINTLTNVLVGLVVAFYLGGVLWNLFSSYRAASADERESQGLNLVLIGTAVGIIPMLLANVVGIFNPQIVLPGSDFYFLLLILIPITWSMATVKS
jgi:hypothetical protein